MSDYARTRRAVHGLAELVLAGPRYRQSGDIRLRVGPNGIRTWADPEVSWSGGVLVSGDQRVETSGLTYAACGEALGLEACTLEDVYGDGPGVALEEVVDVDLGAAGRLEAALQVGDEALAAVFPDAERILWPEHFDVAVTVAGVNYGVSPGDRYLADPYAYVGPHRVPAQGGFWNAPFGAARPLDGLGGPEEVAAFFARGAEEARASATVDR